MANPHDVGAADNSSTPSIYLDKTFIDKHKQIKDAILRNDLEYLGSLVKMPKMGGPVNLSEDHLISVLIGYEKSDLVVKLLKEIQSKDDLLLPNFDGDTALHVAAAVGDVKVAEALIRSNNDLLKARNKQQEIPLHKAALYGEKRVFWKLVEHDSASWEARRQDGATVLHCAIMGNAPKLALDIALQYQDLMTRRNSRAVTPLQLVVTIPQAFRSKLLMGPLEALIYEWIPLEESTSTDKRPKGDEEDQLQRPFAREASHHSNSPVGAADDSRGLRSVMRYRSKFPPNYTTFFDLVAMTSIPASWIQILLFRILKQYPSYWDFFEKGRMPGDESKAPSQGIPQPTTSQEIMQPLIQAMELIINHMAKDPAYRDFILKGITLGEGNKSPSQQMTQPTASQEPMPPIQNEPKSHKKDDMKDPDNKRWDESPLTLGAKMGLHEFVEQILKVCPQSAKYRDTEGRNVLQVAIQNGHEKIVEIVESMATGINPLLPSWLLSSIDEKTKNTILHFAAEETVKGEAAPLQLQHELQWFERVKKLVPKDLEYSRNESEKTAQELFTEKHKDMVKNGKDQLMEMGKTCSSLVAAVVFASSFSIPGEKDTHNNPVFYHKIAFKVFSHAYVIGLSCAATALVLFLSLLTSPYREQDFRRSLPTKYFFANMSFFLALVALLVAFSCNIYLNIYGGRKAETSEIVPLVCELTIFPVVCGLVLLYRGSTFGLGSFLRHVWR